MPRIPEPLYVPPGVDPIDPAFNPPARAPGCWRTIAILLIILLPFAACGGFGFAASARPPSATPTSETSATPTSSPSSTPTATGTTRPSATPTASATPTNTRVLVSGGASNRLQLTSTPTVTPTFRASPTPVCMQYYRIKVGDSLSTIASRYRVTTATIARINSITRPDLLYVGVVLKIPTCRATPNPTGTP